MKIGSTLNTAVTSLDKQLAQARKTAEDITKDLEVDAPKPHDSAADKPAVATSQHGTINVSV